MRERAKGEKNEKGDEAEEDLTIKVPRWVINVIQEQYQNLLLAPIAVLVSSLLLKRDLSLIYSWIVVPCSNLLLRTVGMTLGVGLGLGLAAHVYDTLDELKYKYHQRHQNTYGEGGPQRSQSYLGISKTSSNSNLVSPSSTAGIASPIKRSFLTAASTAVRGDDSKSVYAELMSSSGYDVIDTKQFGTGGSSSTSSSTIGNNVNLRGQILKVTSDFFRRKYPFTNSLETGQYQGSDPQQYKAVQCMLEQWPTLPSPVSIELGRFIEHLLRDYVASWYSMVDSGCKYEDERGKREEGDAAAGSKEEGMDDLDKPLVSTRKMITTTALHRPIPLLNTMYISISLILGNLSQRVEGVNVLSLLLLKWIKVISHSLRVYREMRQAAWAKQHPEDVTPSSSSTSASLRKSTRRTKSTRISNSDSTSDLDQQQSYQPRSTQQEQKLLQQQKEASESLGLLEPVSEMAVTKEFLLRNKLHRAVTFGIDVPSLLFADANGKECGGPNESRSTEDILEERLFAMVGECELDYNRVLGNRLARALLPRAEYSSPIIRTLITEMMAGCVLSPVMSCFCPEYMNSWILQACEASAEEGASEEAKEDVEVNSSEGVSNAMKQADENSEWRDGDELDVEREAGVEIGLEESLNKVNSKGNVIEKRNECDDVLAELPYDDDLPSSPQSRAAVKLQDGTSPGKSSVGIEMSMSATDIGLPSNEISTDDDNIVTIEDQSGGDLGAANLDNSQAIEFDEQDDDMLGDQSQRSLQQSLNAFTTEIVEEGCQQRSQNTIMEAPTGDFVLPLLTMSIIDLQRFMDFEECREARAQGKEVSVSWDDQEYQDSVCQLVLIIEAALLHGRRKERLDHTKASESTGSELENQTKGNGLEGEIVAERPRYKPESLSQILMDLTSDINAVEDRLTNEEERMMDEDEPYEGTPYNQETILKPSLSELSTLRTLIKTWLHTGQSHRVLMLLVNAPKSILIPFFEPHSFLRTEDNARGFLKMVKSLDGLEVFVDSAVVLSKPSMDVNQDGSNFAPRPSEEEEEESKETTRKDRLTSLASEQANNSRRGINSFKASIGGPKGGPTDLSSNMRIPVPLPPASGTPRYLDFRRNANFASSLRAERERRAKSWVTSSGSNETTKGVPVLSRAKGMGDENVKMQRDLHQLARVFYAGTNIISIRNGARRKSSNANLSDPQGQDGMESTTSAEIKELTPLSLLTVEMASGKRRIEVPDEDSSFLLRAQPRPLNAVGLHRDQRNHEQSYKVFVATYEEPALPLNSKKYTGGKYVKRCQLRYFPNDRTASIVPSDDHRELDARLNKPTPPETIQLGSSSAPYLSPDFLRERHLCQKWAPKGAAPRSGSILASSVMESSDFTAAPRNGKAIEFVYRTSLFERPYVELNGKKFQVHDAVQMATHRADASALEMSDASLSIALMHIGRDWAYVDDDGGFHAREDDDTRKGSLRRGSVETAKDGSPVVFIKYNRKLGEKTVSEIKPYRTSFVRAALMVQSARTEAQTICLTKCVQAGSARSATKARTDSLLMPCVKLLDFASSPEREKQSILLRDLKLGINHIDREQLRRNALLFPRDPTILENLTAAVEGATSVKESGALGSSLVLYKVRCTATISLSGLETEDELTQYAGPDGAIAKQYREEWIVYRQFKEFSVIHKHLKSQVAATEQSASAGARLVGAATAAFSVSAATGGQKRRKGLMPSLGQASKAGALGVTKKAIQKRCAILDNYLKYLLSPNHLLNRCSELLLFLGAAYPLPAEVRTGAKEPYSNVNDPLGRVSMTRVVYLSPASQKTIQRSMSELSVTDDTVSVTTATTREDSVSRSLVPKENAPSLRGRAGTEASVGEETDDGNSVTKSVRVKEMEMIPSIKAKIDEVPLSQVRNGIFELIRYQFDFDNASFFRNRMFAALKTMSFAVTSSGEFRKMLYEMHIKYVNPAEVAGWIKFLTDMLWPDGVFFQSSPPQTEEEKEAEKQKAKVALRESFPDQLKSVLGQEISHGGLDMLHEMLQNRIVVKSLSYMLFDLLWLEIFPELQDILTGGEALHSE